MNFPAGFPGTSYPIVCIQESRLRKFIPQNYSTIRAEKKTWTDKKRERKRETIRERKRKRKEERDRERECRDATRAIFSARIVKQQKIINHRDFYTPARGDKFNNLTTARCFSPREIITPTAKNYGSRGKMCFSRKVPNGFLNVIQDNNILIEQLTPAWLFKITNCN